ncbi:MAG TPA: response regulator transcription factor [Solirubrobacteraceae bacterium]|nr:response regulator transcription factor [Solirubrobacteraceae bacterium]
MIRLLLAEDHPVVRVGLERLLANVDEIEVVGTASNGAEAVELCERLRPDVVLMDLSMPVLDGVEATKRIDAAHDGTVSIVVLTSFSDREQVLAALDAGASGYLLKDADPDELIRGIHAAARGEAPIAPKAARELLATRSERKDEPELSRREREVLELVAQGLPNKRIALELSISEKTVKTHLTSIFERLGVSDRYQAALWAHRHGLA